MTNCLTCHKQCESKDLDENYECEICQAKFYNKMLFISKRGSKFKQNQTYAHEVAEGCVEDILIDATNYYKIRFPSKQKLVNYLRKKYEIRLTPHVLDLLTHDTNLRKYGLKWKYKEKSQ